MSDRSVDLESARTFLLTLHGRGVGQGDVVLHTSPWRKREYISQVGCEISPEGDLQPVDCAPDAADLGRLAQERDIYVTVCRFDPNRVSGGQRNSRKQADACWCPAVMADIDVKPEGEKSVRSVEELEHLLRVLDGLVPSSMVVESGSGGVHVYWLLAEPLLDMARARRLRTCWIAHLNGVATEALGRPVEFDPVGDLARVMRVPGTLRWPKKITEQPAPVVLRSADGPLWDAAELERMLPAVTQQRYDRPVIGTTDVDLSDPAVEGRVKRALDGERDRVAQERVPGRNAALNKAAYTLGGFGAWGALEVETAFDALVSDACRVNGLLEEDGYAQCEATFRSGWEAGLLAPIDLGELRAPTQAVSRHARSLVNWSTLWNRPRETSDWLCEPLLPRGRGVAMFSPAKTGKSLLSLDVAARVAQGLACLDQPAGEAREVVYLDLEMTEDDLHERLSDMGYGPETDLSHLHYYLLPDLPPLDTPEGGRELTEIVEHHGADLAVIDTTSRVLSGPENDSDTLRAYWSHTGRPLKALGACVWRLDHAGKDLQRGQRGTSAKNDDVDLVWELTAKKDGLHLKATHSRVRWVQEEVNLRRLEDPHLEHRVADEAYPSGTRELAQVMDDLGLPPDATRRQAGDVLRERGHKARNELVSAALRLRRRRK